jgi:DNA-binding HxlR family transcriptional regulator
MDTLKNILKDLLGNDFRLNEALRLETLKKFWPLVYGQSRQIYPSAYDSRKKILTLTAKTSILAHNERYAIPRLIESYKNYCPNITIKEIRLSANGFAAPPEEPLPDKTDRRKVCPVCKQKFWGGGSICVLCRNKKEARLEAEILRCLAETPWVRYRDIKTALPQISEAQFNQTLAELQAETLAWLWHNPDKSAAVNYVLLKTGFTPAKINDKIILENLPKKLYKLIYETQGA